jgi:bifunctional DNA-binding transcriptional regulator/antitoxin component of YhaV-PrlF toxin-antitoxin module
MKTLTAVAFAIALAVSARAELRIPASTAYGEPWEGGAKINKDGIAGWKDSAQKILWFGEIKAAGKLDASLVVRLPAGAKSKLRLTIAGQTHEAVASGGAAPGTVSFGSFTIAQPGYVRFELSSANSAGKPNGDIDALVLDGPATADAHFNMEPRRNAASVHLHYTVPKDAAIEWFYNEVTAVADPVHTFEMACGFSRGYFGMQVNSPTERRIIFSVWDAASGQSAKDRTTVAEENHAQLLGKGPGVVAGVFGNEGTGGHSHFVYPWKTGEAQKFLLGAKADGANTIYTGWWFHPAEKKWMLIASFRAPKDGKLLRGLHSFSENFGGDNGHLQRKTLCGSTASWAWKAAASSSHRVASSRALRISGKNSHGLHRRLRRRLISRSCDSRRSRSPAALPARAEVIRSGDLGPRQDDRLAIRDVEWHAPPMTATFTIDDAGQINLPEAVKRVFGAEPGVRLRAEVTADRIEIVKDIPVVTEGVLENGVLVLPRLGIKMDAGAAIRAERDEQAERALRR